MAPAIALITGSAQRIGRVLALDLARHGWAIAVHCHRSTADAEALAAILRTEGTPVAILQADLSDMGAVERLIPECVAKLGAPACLINNASMFAYDEVATLRPEVWDAQLAVNLRAPVFLAKAFASALPDGVEGNVINLVDQRVWKPTPRYFSYAVSKSGLWNATRTLAQALAPRVRVNAIAPGPTLKNVRQSEEEFRRQCEATILGRGTTPEEIARAVRFILDAPAMTGQMIALDGGQHLAWDTPDVRHASRG
jgi:NAD(P)-dependent dehydrogenase (short-subunit alcohol dehydrogenase family)